MIRTSCIGPGRLGRPALLVALAAAGCAGAPSGVHLDSVLPATAAPGARVDLFGGGFGSGGSSFVTLGGATLSGQDAGVVLPRDAARRDGSGATSDAGTPSGRVLDWEPTHIALLVPAGRTGDLFVTVTVGGAVSNALPLAILAPDAH